MQIMGEFIRILKISETVSIALQLLQTISIMIQNFKSEHAIYYIFSKGYTNYLITYPFDVHYKELLSYYVTFLRAISGKLSMNIISLLVKIRSDEVVSFPLYNEAVRFAFHEEKMVRTAIRTMTLNVYNVGDECINRYVTRNPQAVYFSDLINYLKKQCINLDGWVSEAVKKPSVSDPTSCVLAAVAEIEDTLYYLYDIISSGVPSLGRLVTENMLVLLVFPLLLPSLARESVGELQISATTSLFLLCCILRIVRTRDLVNSIGAALFCFVESFVPFLKSKSYGDTFSYGTSHKSQQLGGDTLGMQAYSTNQLVGVLHSSSFQIHSCRDISTEHNSIIEHLSLRDLLLSYVISGNDAQVMGSLGVLANLLQIKELEESTLEALGILPQRRQHKKLLLKASVGEDFGEEKLFSPVKNLAKDGVQSELERCMQKLKDQYGLSCVKEPEMRSEMHSYQVLDALISLFCRLDLSAEALWDGVWLLRQLLPYSVKEFSGHYLNLLEEIHKNCTNCLLGEISGIWCDVLIPIIEDAWKQCKRGESSFAAGERMYKNVKVFVLGHLIRFFRAGETFPDAPPLCSPLDPINFRAKNAGIGVLVPKPGIKLNLVDAVPCRIAFKTGQERQFCFMGISRDASGWLILADELPSRQGVGVVRVIAPLAGSDPRVDKKHPHWLHLRIRPSTLPFINVGKTCSSGNRTLQALGDGRWTLAFRDEQCCKSAESMILEEMQLQCIAVEKRLHPLLDLSKPVLKNLDTSQFATGCLLMP